MYCNHCGAKLEEGSKFCVKCGTKIEELKVKVVENDIMQQEGADTEESISKVNGSEIKEMKPSEKKSLSKKAKILIAVFSIVFVLIGMGVGIGIYCNSANSCIKGYAKAIVNEKWDKVFQYTVDETEGESFATWANELLTPIDSYTIEEVKESDNQREYKVVFQDKDGKEVYENQYSISRQEKNKLLIFPNWKMENSSLMVKEAVLQIPAGAQLFIDGNEIDTTALENDANGTMSVALQNIYAGPHSVKMTKQFYQEYDEVILITEQIALQGISPLELTVSDNVVQDTSFQVVSGSELLIDDVKVEKEYRTSVENGIDIYTIPFLEKGEHKIKVSKKYYDDYEETVQFDSSVEKSLVECQIVKESEAWRVAYQEFLTALNQWDVEAMEGLGVSAADQLQSDYNYQVGTLGVDDPLRFALIYLNDDNTPEILIDTGMYGYVATYYDDQVEFIAVSSDGISAGSRLGGERGEFGFVLEEGLILDGGAGGYASSVLRVWKYERGYVATTVAEIYEDRDTPEYSYINSENVEQTVAAEKMEEYWNKASNITTQLLNEGNIQNAIWGVEIDWESSIDPSVWLNAFINQMYDEDIVYIDDTAFEVAFYDINQDGLPEIKIDGVGYSKLLYMDNDMKLCWIGCDLGWVLSDGTVVTSGMRIEASEPIVYIEYQYDKATGTYKEQSEVKAIETEEFLKMEDSPNIDSYKIMGVFAFEEATARLEELAKHAASVMGVTSDIADAREKNALKSGAEFEGIGLSEKVKAEDFKAYLDAYCENYTYMVTEKKFGYMQDYLYYGDKPSKGYDCVTEMQRMLGYDVIDSMTLTSTKIKDITKTDESTVQMHTVEKYHVYYNMSLEQLKKNTKIYEQCKDKVSEDISEYQVEVNIKQKVFYELKLDGNQWKFYRYMEGVDQTTEVVDCKAL